METSLDCQEDGTYLPWDVDEIPLEIKQKAQKELGETRKRKDEALVELKKMLKAEKELNSCMAESFLLKFLRCRKFNTIDAFKSILNYYRFKARYSRMLMDFVPCELIHIFKMNVVTPLPFRNESGSVILVHSPGRLNLNTTNAWEYLAAIILHLEDHLRNEVTQICGGVIVFDYRNVQMSLIADMLNPRYLLACPQILKILPARIKAIHTINEPCPVKHLFKMGMRLLPDKMRHRVKMHGSNMASLRKELGLPRSKLPREFGGFLGPLDGEEYTKKLEENGEHFVKLNSYGFVGRRAESQRQSVFSVHTLTSLLPIF